MRHLIEVSVYSGKYGMLAWSSIVVQSLTQTNVVEVMSTTAGMAASQPGLSESMHGNFAYMTVKVHVHTTSTENSVSCSW